MTPQKPDTLATHGKQAPEFETTSDSGQEGRGRGPQEPFDWWPHLMEIRRVRWEPGLPFPTVVEVVAVVDDRVEDQVVELKSDHHCPQLVYNSTLRN
jgi:hypothetical protein